MKSPGAGRMLLTLELIFFAVLAFAVTWAAGSLILLSDQAAVLGGEPRHSAFSMPVGLAFALLLVADIGPAFAAVATVALFGRHGGVRRLLGQFARWRVAWRWYAIALIGPTMISLVAVGAFVATGGRMDASWIALQPGRIALTAVGGWGEELGWRGFAQPRLQGRLGAAAAAVMVGIMWDLWHQWRLVAPGGAAFTWDAALWSMVRLIGVSILIAWIYNRTRASLPAAMAAHVGINAVRLSPDPQAFDALAFALSAAIVVFIAGPRSLVRRGTTLPPPAL